MAMLPLFDSTILSRQVQSVRQMGAEKIIFLSPAMHAELLQYADDLKNHDIKVDIARNAEDLQRYVSPDDDLIFLADGVFPDASIEQESREQSDELIYVVGNADHYQNFERIDLTHRWLGIAILRSERLAEIADIPDDWNIGSALLRTAVQAECRRELVSDADMETDAVLLLQNAQESAAYAKRQLSEIALPKQNFLDQFVTWPLMRKLMPLLWQSENAKNYSGFASLGAATLALILGFLGWPVLSLALLFAGSLALVLRHRISVFSTQNSKVVLVGLCFRIIAAIALTVTVVQQAKPDALFADITVLLVLCGNLWLAHTLSVSRGLQKITPDIPLILLALFIASAFGFVTIGLYSVALICLAYLIIAQREHVSRE